MSRMLLSDTMSLLVGLIKMAAATTYRDALIPVPLGQNGYRRPLSLALIRFFLQGSMAKMNNIGEMGPPGESPFHA
jgi:hypothetical protein